jgi:hypothetical protein
MASRGPFYQVGVYVCEVVSQAIGEAGTGTPQFILRVKVIGVPITGTSEYETVRQSYERTIYMPITDKTMQFFEENMERLGFDGDSLAQLDPSTPNHISFVHKMIDCYCKHEENQKGESMERWMISRGAPAIEAVPVPLAKMRKLDALWGKARGKSGRTVVPSSPLRDQSQEITDDDIPF